MKLRFSINVPNWLDRIFARPVLAYRLRRYSYPFRRIRLTEGKFALVDQQDFYEFNRFEWCLKEDYGRFYAVRFNTQRKKNSKILSLHREIMKAPLAS